MPEMPWRKWFPSDWASDPGLSMCDIATQGVWINAVNAMMLTNQPRITGSVEELARVCRCRPTQFQAAIAELKSKQVCIVHMQGECITLECRRMLREHNNRELKRKAANSRWCKGDAEAMQTPMQTDYAQGHARSASASASTSKEGVQGEPSPAELASRIYDAYPLKVGKPAALKSIQGAMRRGHTFDFLMQRVRAYAAARNGDKSFVPHPSTWFNQDRFNDDPSTWGNQHFDKPKQQNMI